ncbi:hypothetical protein T07_3494 [Trichinella nelsoni]|uniref:Uncharacterized protein n=1 Tax=Trichinella nelsoni TaxID=6336 RepID=A0A0V0REK2_9BILA|nr:hypothetical protein T07_527 [Trichinella nelsoni]KRX12677.1 hypothetical protein T07_9074 [Trichinella nelsoni]KRX12684.1 hypothetical protein T07_3249 [Trichinella nelsoni]KRX12908.1 hypothetical protein T07_3494 [Trichinella nelsoni]
MYFYSAILLNKDGVQYTAIESLMLKVKNGIKRWKTGKVVWGPFARSCLRPVFSRCLSYIFLIYLIFSQTGESPSFIFCLRVFHLIVNSYY